MLKKLLISCFFTFTLFPFLSQAKTTLNGFAIDKPLIAENEILAGGPPRDGIPPIENPKFMDAPKATFLKDGELVLGIHQKKNAKAYPIKILNWHEIVNDQIGQTPIVISYCPLCGTGMVFERNDTTFGVSGLLYQSDLLLYDRKTDSLWSQILMQAVNGPRKGEKLKTVPSSLISWGLWKKNFPQTKVLSPNTGHFKPYNRSPYGNYNQNEKIFFPIRHKNTLYHPKTITLAILEGEKIRLYPMTALNNKKSPLTDMFAGRKFHIHFHEKTSYIEAKSSDDKPVKSIRGFWFALATFYPKAEVYGIQKK